MQCARLRSALCRPLCSAPRLARMTPEACDKALDDALARSAPVKFMVAALAKAGCAVDKRFFSIETCAQSVVGGFRPPDGVVMCHNQLASATEFENMLVHELVHAFDHCRGADLSWNNCRHHACSEVRAANLSGDCSFSQELLRGNYGLRAQQQACVRRRAELSVAMNPACAALGAARAAVDGCFADCYRDTAPFDRVP